MVFRRGQQNLLVLPILSSVAMSQLSIPVSGALEGKLILGRQ